MADFVVDTASVMDSESASDLLTEAAIVTVSDIARELSLIHI